MATIGAAVIAVSAASGCGGAAQHRALTSPRPLSPGARIFIRSCAACHTLAGHDTRSSGGDLAILHTNVQEIESFTRIMPGQPRLTATDVAAVAKYIVSIERNAHSLNR